MLLTRNMHTFFVCPQCADIVNLVCANEEHGVCICECPSCGNSGDSSEFRHVTEVIWINQDGEICKPGIAEIFGYRR